VDPAFGFVELPPEILCFLAKLNLALAELRKFIDALDR